MEDFSKYLRKSYYKRPVVLSPIKIKFDNPVKNDLFKEFKRINQEIKVKNYNINFDNNNQKNELYLFINDIINSIRFLLKN